MAKTMAILKSGLLKLGAAQVSTLALPLGVIVLGALWVRRARAGLPPSTPRQRGSATPRDEADAVRRTTAAGNGAGYGASPGRSGHVANTATPESSTPHGTGREALLSRIIDDNVRLREALK